MFVLIKRNIRKQY